MWLTVNNLAWSAWLAFGAFVAVSALAMGQEQVRNIVIAQVTTVGATLWWMLCRHLTSTRQGGLVTALGLINCGVLVLGLGLLAAAGIRVFGEGYAVFG